MYWVMYGEERVLSTGLCIDKNVYSEPGSVWRRTCTVYWVMHGEERVLQYRVRYGEERVLCTGLCMERNAYFVLY